MIPHIHYRGSCWRYEWFETGTMLTEQGREDLITNSLDMYLDKEKTKKVKGDGFEGILKDTRKTSIVGGLTGRLYNGELDIDGMSDSVPISFMIIERIDPSLN